MKIQDLRPAVGARKRRKIVGRGPGSGHGEMNAKELFETTMDPVRRKLLRVDLTAAVEAEEMFTKLMGEEVEPRRQFIEDNALNVRNLDI